MLFVFLSIYNFISAQAFAADGLSVNMCILENFFYVFTQAMDIGMALCETQQRTSNLIFIIGYNKNAERKKKTI